MTSLADDVRYLFSCAFLEGVDPIASPEVGPDFQFLAILKDRLPSGPKRAVNPTLTDILRQIAEHTVDWTGDKVAAADLVLAERGALTLSQARQVFPAMKLRTSGRKLQRCE